MEKNRKKEKKPVTRQRYVQMFTEMKKKERKKKTDLLIVTSFSFDQQFCNHTLRSYCIMDINLSMKRKNKLHFVRWTHGPR